MIGGLTGVLLCSSVAAVASEPMNVVFILADDLGYGDLSVYNPNGLIRTPVLDSLAGKSIRFTNAHASAAVSTPTRYGLMTGQYPWRSRLKQGVLWAWEEPLLTDEITLPEMFRSVGYSTALVGKWHLGITFPTKTAKSVDKSGDGDDVDYLKPVIDGPTHHGFDYYYGDDVPNFPPYVFIENDRFTDVPTKRLPDDMPGVHGVMSEFWNPEILLQTEVRKASEYILRHKDKPFFLMVSLTAPHTPIAPSEKFIGKSKAGRYGDFVEEMDSRIGEILATIRKAGLANNTIIVFSSDNGSSFQDGCSHYSGLFGSILDWGHNPSGHLRGMKSDAWEGGHRIPMMIYWPEVTDNGKSCHDLVCDLDIYATFAQALSINLPKGTAADSRSLLPLLGGKTPERKRLVSQSGNGILSYIEGDWKLIAGSGSGGSLNPYEPSGDLPHFEGGKWTCVQLFNIKVDAEEHYNLSAQLPDRVNAMMKALADEIKTTEKAPYWKQTEWVSEYTNE